MQQEEIHNVQTELFERFRFIHYNSSQERTTQTFLKSCIDLTSISQYLDPYDIPKCLTIESDYPTLDKIELM